MGVLVNYFKDNGVAINVRDYAEPIETIPNKPMPDWFYSTIDAGTLANRDKVIPILDGWTNGTTVYDIMWNSEKCQNIPTWYTTNTDCNGDKIKYSNKYGTSTEIVIISDIIRRAVESGSGLIYLYFPPEEFDKATVQEMFFNLTRKVEHTLSRLTNTSIMLLDLFTGAMNAEQDRGYLLNVYPNEYRKFMTCDFTQLLDKMVTVGMPESAVKHVAYEFMSQTDTHKYDLEQPANELTVEDINLELEVGFAIESTPYTPEVLSYRLMAEFGYALDTSKIIRGTHLAKAQKIIRYLPPVKGPLSNNFKMIDKVIEFCLQNANIKETSLYRTPAYKESVKRIEKPAEEPQVADVVVEDPATAIVETEY